MVSAEPHPYLDYEKKVFTKDGREEYMEQLKALDEQHMKEYGECVDHLVDSMGEQKK